MYDMCIMAEKPSQYRHMAKAFGGFTGNFHGETYKLTHSHGHLMQLVDPPKQVDDKHLKARYKSWKLDTMPWKPSDFKWRKTYIKGDKKDVMAIKKDASDCKSIVIGTDDDPSGEGDLLGYEIVQAIGWKRPVYRIRFKDEQPKNLQQALINKKPMRSKSQWGHYLEADCRSHWDFTSMQLTRIGTTTARNQGYATVVNEGRLKSVILYKIYQRLLARKNYHKTPYYEVRYKDGNGHIYSRFAKSKDKPKWRHKNKDDAKKELAKLGATDVPAGVKKVRKTSAPGSMLNLSSLGALLEPKGYSPSEILKSYQNLYEHEYVSYPRTADTKITDGDFKALLPKTPAIAKVVGVDPSLLTHKTLRKKFRIVHEDHGANRPGPNVPKNVQDLSKFGTSAPIIYKTLARNYLAIMCDDYVYDKITAHLSKHPEFTTSFNEPVALNCRKVFGSKPSKQPGLSKPAKAFIYTGSNPKPAKPSSGWIARYLKKENLGTGATRLGVMGILTKGSKKKINDKRGKYTLTQAGLICAYMATGTWISNVKVTKQLYKLMDAVKNYKYKPEQVVNTCTQLVKHDKPILEKNAKGLRKMVGAPKGNQKFVKKEKVAINFNGNKVNINRKFAGHRLTDDEVKKFDALHFEADKKQAKAKKAYLPLDLKSKKGKSFKANVDIAKQSYNGHTFYGMRIIGFADSGRKDTRPSAKINGKVVHFWPNFFGKKCTKSELQMLEAGKTVTFTRKSKKGKNYKVKGKLVAKTKFNGKPGIENEGFAD